MFPLHCSGTKSKVLDAAEGKSRPVSLSNWEEGECVCLCVCGWG